MNDKSKTRSMDDEEFFRKYSKAPPCIHCIHYNSQAMKTCKAFPEGIPDEIWLNNNPHTQSYPGDHGIQFEHKMKFKMT